MTGIGIRVYSFSKVYYSVIEEVKGAINYITISFIQVPLALERPERLNFIRNTLIDLLNLYHVDSAVIRIAEFGQSFKAHVVERLYLEGVIQESLAASNISKFIAAQISEITHVAGIPKTDFKKLADAEIDFVHFPNNLNWKKDYCLEERESVLASYTSLKL